MLEREQLIKLKILSFTFHNLKVKKTVSPILLKMKCHMLVVKGTGGSEKWQTVIRIV